MATKKRLSQTLSDGDLQNMMNFILQSEGSHYNPTDPHGGSTYGLSAETLARANREGVTSHTDIRTLPRKDAEAIYKKYYLSRSRGLNTTYPLALAIYDAEINQGRGGMTKAMQTALQSMGYDIAVDGKWGNQTQEAFNSARADYGDIKLARALLDTRENMYRGYSHKQHIPGWLNRLNNLRKTTGLAPIISPQLNYPLATETLGEGMGFKDMLLKSGWEGAGGGWKPNAENGMFAELLRQPPATGYSQSERNSDVKMPQPAPAEQQGGERDLWKDNAGFFDDLQVMINEAMSRATQPKKYQPVTLNTTY